eukprot:TRINITY_DN35665_c0_g1_i1.p1 TRINITY_DN35665_c0_g1~~TRINITY_DN35665_c0_g1_i1.p1  ORF type:complete len:516 (-),score=104.15 TRINITY_DN35665_c0_g1_i1:45-1592(-)
MFSLDADEHGTDAYEAGVRNFHTRRLAPQLLCYAGGARFEEMQGRQLSEVYELDKELGVGASSTVYLATDKSTGEKRAVKMVYNEVFDDDCHLETDHVNPFEAELQVLQTVDHPNIVRLFDSFIGRGVQAIAMEFCAGGNIQEYFGAMAAYTEETVARAIQQICSAVAYLHGRDICHCDLKPENILVASEGGHGDLFAALTQEHQGSTPDFPLLKVADFGVAAIKPARAAAVGASSYAAPEVLENAPCDEMGDMWSLGMVGFVLLSGVDPDTVRSAILQTSVPPEMPELSEKAVDCISWCLQLEKELRGPANAVLCHDWLTDILPREDSPELADAVRNLRKFGRLSRTQRAMMQIAAYTMPSEEISKLTAVFEALDTDNDGSLSLGEIKDALLRLDSGCKDHAAVFEAMDLDRSDSVSYTEFIAACLSRKQRMCQSVLWRAFCAVDLDGTGSISKSNLKDALSSGPLAEFFGEEFLEEAFASMDLNSDAQIDFKEFSSMMAEGSGTSAPTSPTDD